MKRIHNAIIAWENLLDEEGKPIPCTLENKLKLMKHPQFARFMGRFMGRKQKNEAPL